MDKKVLITGANGFIGGKLIQEIDSLKGFNAVGTDLTEKPGSNYLYHSGDLSSESFREFLRQKHTYDTVIHLAGSLSKNESPESRRSLFEINSGITLGMLELAHSCSASFIFLSTGLVYGNQPPPFSETMTPLPRSFYAESKLLAEKCIQYFSDVYKMRSVVFRPSVIYGPGQTGNMFIPSLTNALLQNQKFPMTPGKQKRDFVYIDDIANAVKSALTDKEVSGTFNLGSGESRTLLDVAETAEKATGKHSLIQPGSISYRENEVWEYLLDIKKAGKALKWKPETGIEQGIQKTVDSMKENM
ncbi:MAG: NAD-dependent epimerase/dehydratase family protein [Chitinivibrionales bacterium]